MSESYEITLLTKDGNRVEISVPEENELEIYLELRNCLSTGGWFNQSGWDMIEIEYMGTYLTELNCRDIIGII